MGRKKPQELSPEEYERYRTCSQAMMDTLKDACALANRANIKLRINITYPNVVEKK